MKISNFYKTIDKYSNFDYEGFFKKLTSKDIAKALDSSKLTELEFLSLLSPIAENYLEDMALKSNNTTIKQFGKTIQLYTPIYISNHCTNECIYCGFNKNIDIPRHQLSIEEIEKEAAEISKTGLRHILVLTGSAKHIATTEYIVKSIEVIKKYFTSISIEMYPMEIDDYNKLFSAGADGLTIYQETYDEELYKKLHLSGPKRNYQYRLSAPDRACIAGMRRINVGTLLGLKDWKQDILMSGLHCKYLQDKYPDVEISLSLPRMQDHNGKFKNPLMVSDKSIVQAITAFRLFMPRAGINISTRENASFRNNIIPLGVTKFSAGSTTAVGGHTSNNSTKQFELSDNRTVDEIKKIIVSKGYQAVFKDWQYL